MTEAGREALARLLVELKRANDKASYNAQFRTAAALPPAEFNDVRERAAAIEAAEPAAGGPR